MLSVCSDPGSDAPKDKLWRIPAARLGLHGLFKIAPRSYAGLAV